MFFSGKLVVYGTGGAAKRFIDQNCDLKDRIYAAVGKNVDRGERIGEIRIEEDSILNEISEPFDLVIASQYYDSIYQRLLKEEKLSNNNLKGIYTLNLYMELPPYSEDAYISDSEWNWLFDKFKDSYSKEVLNLIKSNRGKSDANRLLNIKEVLAYAGDEDYWKTIKGTNQHDKAIILDCGAYIGDKVYEIVEAVGRPVYAYYGFEPMSDNFDMLCKVRPDCVEHFYPINKAVGDENKNIQARFNKEQPDASSIVIGKAEDEVIEINVTKIDSLDLEEGYDIYIKMDIEGSELDALRGAENTIRKMRPNLAICLYHQTEDLYKIPKWIDSLKLGYQMFLSGGNHTILIAVPIVGNPTGQSN